MIAMNRLLVWTTISLSAVSAFTTTTAPAFVRQASSSTAAPPSALFVASSSTDGDTPAPAAEVVRDYEGPDDAVINIKPNAMSRLRELREKKEDKALILRMGVRNGGCSGLSYVMDFSTAEEIQDDDAIDEYPGENIRCVVDSKSMLYLYGLELDYSDELIGGGFQFFNPNAEDSCGCGSSFGV